MCAVRANDANEAPRVGATQQTECEQRPPLAALLVPVRSSDSQGGDSKSDVLFTKGQIKLFQLSPPSKVTLIRRKQSPC